MAAFSACSAVRPADLKTRCHGCRDANGKLRLGDVIVGIDDKPVKLQRDLFEALDDRRPGDKVRVMVVRDGDKESTVTIMVELGGRELAGPSD